MYMIKGKAESKHNLHAMGRIKSMGKFDPTYHQAVNEATYARQTEVQPKP